MNITAQIEEYKAKIEALASKAALADSLQEKLSALEVEKESFNASIVEKDSLIESLNTEKDADKQAIAELTAKIEGMEAEKKASDEKALEIVASLGLTNIPVITVIETDKPSADQIRQKYLAISDSIERAKFYAENKEVILNGTL